MSRVSLIVGALALALALGLSGHVNRSVPLAHAAGWYYQVGTAPVLGGNPPTHIYSLFLYDPSETVFPRVTMVTRRPCGTLDATQRTATTSSRLDML